MRFLHHHHRSRRAAALTTSLVALTAFGGLLSAPSFGQDLFVTSDATIAGGNPINGDFGRIVIGVDAANVAYPNITADITGGSSTDDIFAAYSSLVTISAGTFGKESTGGISYQALGVNRGSTVNLTGGTFRSFISIGKLFGSDGTTSTFNMSGGMAPYVENNYGGVINITGGSVLPSAGYTRGVVSNRGDGTVNISGGTLDSISAFGFDGNVTNFGGTATANNLYISFYYGNSVGNVTGGTLGAVAVGGNGVANISGGSVGAVGGVTISGGGVVNFTGSDFAVNQTGTSGFFDEDNYANFVVNDYTVAGTLSDGATLTTTLSGGDYSNDGTTLTFGGSAYAPDLYVTTDQTVSGVYNNVNIGVDETFSEFSNPTATIADGTDTVYAYTYSGSVTNMTGGIVRGDFYAQEQSQVNVSGGEIRGGLYAYNNSVLNVSGGSVAYGVGAYGDSAVTVSGGVSDSGYSVGERATLAFQGSGLSGSGTTGTYFDGYTNYSAAGDFTVAGTLSDGTVLNQTIQAGGVSGDAGQQTLVAPIAASNLNLTENTSVNTFNNQVRIGQNADESIQNSPTVSINEGADIAQIYVRNDSVLNVLGGVVRGTINVGKDAEANISGGTLGSVRQNEAGNGKMTVSGGSIAYLVPRNDLTITGGDITTVDTYSGARVNIFGGNITNVWGYGPNGYINILGGSVSNIIGYGQPFNLYGGNIGSGSIINLRGSPFDLFGVGFSITNGVAGTANGRNGVWWDVTGTLQGGQRINTRYFEANGALTGPANLTTTAAAPEPGTLALMGAGCWVLGVGMMRRKRTT